MRYLLIAAALVFTTTSSASAAPQAGQMDPFGFDFLQFMFKQAGLEPANGRRLPARDTVYISLGRSSYSDEEKATEHIRQGGALLFATDRGTRIRKGYFRLQEGPMTLVGEANRYQGHDDCIRVVIKNDHELTRGLNEIILNRTGWIRRLDGGNWKVLADLPETSEAVLAVRGGSGRSARAVVMADHSPFTNDMLMHGDNAILAVNVVNYLSQDRKYFEFLVDGFPAQSGLAPMLPPDELPDIDPDDIPADTKMAIANRFLKEIERENALNRFLDNVPARIIWRWLIIICTLLLAVFILRRLTSSKSLIQPPGLHAANSSEARAATMVRTGSLRPAAQELARDFLGKLTGDSSNVSAWSINRREVWVAQGVTGSPRRVRADVEKLARLATGSDRRHRVKPKELRKLAARIKELRSLIDSGQLRLERDYTLVRESGN